jgi:hypothetical protein
MFARPFERLIYELGSIATDAIEVRERGTPA